VIETRKSPGAAGTVVSNLRALGASVQAIGLVGDDGNGYDLLKRLKEMQVNCDGLIEVAGYSTPTI
jgi:bifunctional ADP-heptose synthase (sugar kinase/adenylyltransferase)